MQVFSWTQKVYIIYTNMTHLAQWPNQTWPVWLSDQMQHAQIGTVTQPNLAWLRWWPIIQTLPDWDSEHDQFLAVTKPNQHWPDNNLANPDCDSDHTKPELIEKVTKLTWSDWDSDQTKLTRLHHQPNQTWPDWDCDQTKLDLVLLWQNLTSPDGGKLEQTWFWLCKTILARLQHLQAKQTKPEWESNPQTKPALNKTVTQPNAHDGDHDQTSLPVDRSSGDCGAATSLEDQGSRFSVHLEV